eukprot:5933869-Lingulodinium_polyedra.AAC.1
MPFHRGVRSHSYSSCCPAALIGVFGPVRPQPTPPPILRGSSGPGPSAQRLKLRRLQQLSRGTS